MQELYAVVGYLCTSEILAAAPWLTWAAVAGASFAAGFLAGRGRRRRRPTGFGA